MISLCMIVKNEEAVIGRCLDSVKNVVEEINIVDTGSTDRTKEIARDYTDRIYDFEWVDNFAAARNFSFEKAKQDYILWLDADDVLAEKETEKLSTLKKTIHPSVDAVAMDYHLAFDEYGNVTFQIKRNRLVKRKRKFRWIGAVHEYLEVGGTIIQSDIAVTHLPLRLDSDRNLRIYEKRMERGEAFTPRDLFYFANELVDHLMYERAISYYEKFLATNKGWIEDNITACSKLADCYFQLGQPENELQVTFRSFMYDRPRPEFCCRLGYYFLNKNTLETAVFWYTLATQQSETTMGFVNKACSTWLPHLQLCVCHSRLGDYESAYYHNEKAREYRPTDPNVLHNKDYLQGMI
ncbi:glycosyltransferase family 2 protein [Salicibibacter cibi]|uniref:Glycosyltransferase family 2 protein n=1 Tax=Salicibibacter cibi TaxID=2743001 RepID=A0A7T7CFH1_9BACI|nr:glycosyltransferase family 2 protein [Salicibibacter cibi]QQK80089.1 glycosyltransferase family 2 protein [Salicibibacter cibi]